MSDENILQQTPSEQALQRAQRVIDNKEKLKEFQKFNAMIGLNQCLELIANTLQDCSSSDNVQEIIDELEEEFPKDSIICKEIKLKKNRKLLIYGNVTPYNEYNLNYQLEKYPNLQPEITSQITFIINVSNIIYSQIISSMSTELWQKMQQALPETDLGHLKFDKVRSMLYIDENSSKRLGVQIKLYKS
jgi:hypothetical protein